MKRYHVTRPVSKDWPRHSPHPWSKARRRGWGDCITSQCGHLLTGGANRFPDGSASATGLILWLAAPLPPASGVALAQRLQEMAVSSLARRARLRN